MHASISICTDQSLFICCALPSASRCPVQCLHASSSDPFALHPPRTHSTGAVAYHSGEQLLAPCGVVAVSSRKERGCLNTCHARDSRGYDDTTFAGPDCFISSKRTSTITRPRIRGTDQSRWPSLLDTNTKPASCGSSLASPRLTHPLPVRACALYCPASYGELPQIGYAFLAYCTGWGCLGISCPDGLLADLDISATSTPPRLFIGI